MAAFQIVVATILDCIEYMKNFFKNAAQKFANDPVYGLDSIIAYPMLTTIEVVNWFFYGQIYAALQIF